MQKLGNIVTTAKKNNYSEIFNVVNSIDKCITDLPILVVGWKLMTSLFPDANILNKEYNGVKWTFTKTERRCEYEEDIIEFSVSPGNPTITSMPKNTFGPPGTSVFSLIYWI